MAIKENRPFVHRNRMSVSVPSNVLTFNLFDLQTLSTGDDTFA